ncbi:MAG: hypothetical protein ACYDCC_01450 [Actinomycetota bacterium]
MKGRWIAIVVTVLLTAGVVLAVIFIKGPSADRSAVRAYYDTISPLAYEGGRVIQEEVKPSITDLEESKISPAQFRRLDASWQSEFVKIRSEFARARRVSRLNDTAAQYDIALKEYLDFFAALARDSRVSGAAARTAAVRRSFPIGDKANADYDKAREDLKQVMRDVGMAIPANFGLGATRRDLVRSDRNIA